MGTNNLFMLGVNQVIRERGSAWCLENKDEAFNLALDKMVKIRKFLDNYPKYANILLGRGEKNKKQIINYYKIKNRKEKR